MIGKMPSSISNPDLPSWRFTDWLFIWYRQQKDQKKTDDGQEYHAELEQLDTQIESVQDFWRYNNNTPVDQIKMRESLYLFKTGFKPVWEDRRNVLGGSWTFRVGKNIGPDFWTRVQLLAIGEQLQAALDEGTANAASLPSSACDLVMQWNTDEVYNVQATRSAA